MLLGVALGVLAAKEEAFSPAATLACACYVAGKAGEKAAGEETVYTATPTDAARCLKQAVKELMDKENGYEL